MSVEEVSSGSSYNAILDQTQYFYETQMQNKKNCQVINRMFYVYEEKESQ